MNEEPEDFDRDDDVDDETEDFYIRAAGKDDVPVLVKLIKELAVYEDLEEEAVLTEELLAKWMFGAGKAEAVLGVENDEPIGFALFYTSFSTFLGRPGLYLEDLYVQPESRGKGYGKLLLAQLAKLVLERGYGRLEWSCLDWNKPSIQFYLSLGAIPMDEWTVYRLTGENLEALATYDKPIPPGDRDGIYSGTRVFS